MWNARIARQVRRELENLFDRTISQVELAGWLGCSRTAIQSWETGRSTPESGSQFLYWKLQQDPGFIVEIQQWSKQHAGSKHDASEAAPS